MQELKSSVSKTFALLEYFTIDKSQWGVTELAQACGSNKSTVYRFLSDLQRAGILQKHPDTEKYSLGLKLFELGNRVPLHSALVSKTHPELIEVGKKIMETVHIAVLKNNQIFHVDKVESPHGLKLSSHIGGYGPAHATSLGKVLLAHLPEKAQSQIVKEILSDKRSLTLTENTITTQKVLFNELNNVRANGYAIDREESEIGLICVGIPIFNQRNEVVASLSASGPANRFQEREVKNYVACLREGAEAIQNKIGNFKLL